MTAQSRFGQVPIYAVQISSEQCESLKLKRWNSAMLTGSILKKCNQYKAVGMACVSHELLDQSVSLLLISKCTREYTFGQVFNFYDNFIF